MLVECNIYTDHTISHHFFSEGSEETAKQGWHATTNVDEDWWRCNGVLGIGCLVIFCFVKCEPVGYKLIMHVICWLQWLCTRCTLLDDFCCSMTACVTSVVRSTHVWNQGGFLDAWKSGYCISSSLFFLLISNSASMIYVG